MKVTIELDEKQARVVMAALDFYSRIAMGQFDEIHQMLLNTGRVRYSSTAHEYNVGDENLPLDLEYVRAIEQMYRNALFPELHPNAYYGIFSKEVGENAHIAWDIYQTVRHDISWFEYPEGHYPGMTFSTVNFDRPMQVDQKHKLPIVKVEEE
jgi:hypothetical protein